MNSHDTTTTDLLEELYRIDPTLRQYEADLPNLITHLTQNRPAIVINETFVHNLRASILNQASTAPAPNTATGTIPSPFIWWVARLSPLGIAAILLITLIPTITIAPQPIPEVTESEPITQETIQSDEMIATAPSNDTSVSMMTTAPDTMSKMAPQASLEVEPPMSGTTMTITRVTLPEAGWVVIYTDEGGTFGTVLGTIYLTTGVHYDVTVPLNQTLLYPGMITVVVYTGKNSAAFVAENETVQIDALSNAPMTLTVPVISELELQ